MRYLIVEASNIRELQGRVQTLINEGWIPQGGVSAAAIGTLNWWYYQAMTRS